MGNYAEINMGLSANNEVPVYKIEKGHCRTAAARTADGKLIFLLCVSEKYGEPGSVVDSNGEDYMPLVGLELWGAEQLRILGACCNMAADQLEEAERKAAENEDNA